MCISSGWIFSAVDGSKMETLPHPVNIYIEIDAFSFGLMR